MLDERQPASPETITRGVDLIQLISDEFGTLQDTIKSQLLGGVVEIDGKPYEMKDKYRIPYAIARGHTITVIGPERHWKVFYKG